MDRSFNNKSRLLFFALLFLCIFALSCLTPMVSDDFSYCFSWEDNARIVSLRQIPGSMAVHRVLTNGRVFAHGLVQLLLIRPKMIFNLLNAGNAVLLLWLFSRPLQDRSRLALLVFAAVLLWTFQPAFGEVSLWLTGSVNYSWGVSLFLLFLWPYTADYLGLERRRSWWKTLLFLLLCFPAGAWSENGSLAALFAACCLTALTALRERKLDPVALLGILIAAAGFVFLMTAPATTGRAGGADLPTALSNLVQILTRPSRVALLYLLWLFCFVFALAAKGDRRRITLAVILFLAGFGALCAYAFALYFTKRHYCVTVFFTALSAVILLEQALPALKKSVRTVLCLALAGLFAWHLAFGLLDIAVIFKKSLDRKAAIAAALAEGRGQVALEVYQPTSGYSVTFKLNPDPEEWPNTSVALYYGLDRVDAVFAGE